MHVKQFLYMQKVELIRTCDISTYQTRNSRINYSWPNISTKTLILIQIKLEKYSDEIFCYIINVAAREDNIRKM